MTFLFFGLKSIKSDKGVSDSKIIRHIMDNLLIFFLAILTVFGFSGVATAIYFFWLWSGFVKTEWTTLSSFIALLSYWFYGLTGLIFMGGSVLTMICALA